MLSMDIVSTLTLLFHTLFEILTMAYSEYLTIVYYTILIFYVHTVLQK